MKTEQTIFYVCEICGNKYEERAAAVHCESIGGPLMDKGAKIGDRVKILRGDGAGMIGEIDRIFVFSPGWGPACYSHTRGLNAKIIGSFGHRQLCYDDYELEDSK